MKRLTIPDEPIEGGMRRAIIDAREVRKHAMTIYWQLKKYEDTGITPERFKEIDRAYQDVCQEVKELRRRQQWIPCSDKFPETVGRYLVTAVWEDGDFKKHSVYDAVYGSDGIWHVQDYAPAPYKVVAWMPLPELYKEESDYEFGER